MLEKVFNFRDIGGYRTISGRIVRSQCLYRSGALSSPSDKDLARLSDLEIKLIVDLRGDREKDQAPNVLSGLNQLEAIELPIWPKASNEVEHALLAGTIREHAKSNPIVEPDTASAMRNFYRSFVRDHKSEWSFLLRKLTDPGGQPALVHCTGGKDRTGVAAALLLRTLDVPLDTIMLDYLKTNVAVNNWIAVDHPNGLPTFYRAAMMADRSYLEAAFSEIESQFGGFDSYLVNALQFSDEQRKILKQAYLN